MNAFEPLIQKYRVHLAVQNLSPVTIKGYIGTLGIFLRYLLTIGVSDVAAVTKDTINDYRVHCYEEFNDRDEPNSIGTQNNRLKSLKSFFLYLYENGFLPGNPAKDIAFAKLPKRLPRSMLGTAEMKKLLKMPDIRTVVGYRDRVMLEVLYSSGLRASELINLQLTDVDYNDGYVRVNAGKGNKDRVVPIGKIACRFLENYIKSVRPALSSCKRVEGPALSSCKRVEGPQLAREARDNNLFLSYTGARLDVCTLGRVIKQYASRAGFKKRITTHSFRHTCATLMLRNKANIRHIQEMLGHASLDTTQIYTSVTIADLKAAHSKCHPREQDKE